MEFEHQAKACGIDPARFERPPHWLANRSADGRTVLVMIYAGMEQKFACMSVWGRQRGVKVIGVRD
ncbi:hypothetical protein ACX0MU_18225 [Rhizorhabdus wittichii]